MVREVSVIREQQIDKQGSTVGLWIDNGRRASPRNRGEAKLRQQGREGLNIPLVTELETELRVSAMADVVMIGDGTGLFSLLVDGSTCS